MALFLLNKKIGNSEQKQTKSFSINDNNENYYQHLENCGKTKLKATESKSNLWKNE